MITIKRYAIITTLATTIFLSSTLFTEASGNTEYTVQPGDSLWKISQNYHVSVTDLQTWNHLSSSTIQVGQELVISKPATTQIYTVKSGDSLYKIANNFATTVQTIKSLNKLSSDTIYIGQKLKVSGTESQTTNTATTYTVKSGDTLSGIAKKFGMTIQVIKQSNGLSSDLIYVGQKLSLSSNSNETTSQITTNLADTLIKEGKKYLGVPYVWSGTTPKGFDCSGFLTYVFAKVDIALPRTVDSIWNTGKSVTALQKGELVFFETYQSGPSHAGIYLGNRQFLHAGSSTGVTISSLDNSYWSQRYLGAKRYF